MSDAPNASPDPRAEALLGGSPRERLAFRTLAQLLAKPDTIARFARGQDISRQEVYRRLDVAALAGYSAEVIALRGLPPGPVLAACACNRAPGEWHKVGCPRRAVRKAVAA